MAIGCRATATPVISDRASPRSSPDRHLALYYAAIMARVGHAQRQIAAKGWFLHRQHACFETRPRARLRMRYMGAALRKSPHPEEAAKRLSRRTRDL